jgi:hypothetical protein
MRRRPALVLVLVVAAQLALTIPLVGQQDDPAGKSWQLEGLRRVFCVQLLLAPAAEILKDLPPGYRPVPASEDAELHLSLRSVVEGQPEFAAWSPSRLCFDAVDTVRTDEYTLTDRNGRRPQLFGTWTVLAAGPNGPPADVALELFSNSDRLIHSARQAGQAVREARLVVGLVPSEDENGVPSSDQRFQVKLGKTVVTWDGHAARDSTAIREPVRRTWAVTGVRGGIATGEVVLSPGFARAMPGSLKVDGKDELDRALKASPTRFAGPIYLGGSGSISFHP